MGGKEGRKERTLRGGQCQAGCAPGGGAAAATNEEEKANEERQSFVCAVCFQFVLGLLHRTSKRLDPGCGAAVCVCMCARVWNDSFERISGLPGREPVSPSKWTVTSGPSNGAGREGERGRKYFAPFPAESGSDGARAKNLVAGGRKADEMPPRRLSSSFGGQAPLPLFREEDALGEAGGSVPS